MFVICECGYDSGDLNNIHELKEKVDLDGGNFDERKCPDCGGNLED